MSNIIASVWDEVITCFGEETLPPPNLDDFECCERFSFAYLNYPYSVVTLAVLIDAKDSPDLEESSDQEELPVQDATPFSGVTTGEPCDQTDEDLEKSNSKKRKL